jgi:NitT/TauT family transport system ATP-binding protein
MTAISAQLLHIEDLYKFYGQKVVLDNVDLAARAGTFCSVVGPSGCGKSTLFRLILGEEPPSSGEIAIDGSQVTCPGTDRGIVYQRYSLYPHLTVLDNVLLGRNLRTSVLQRLKRRAEFREEAMKYLERMRLAQHAEKFPHELSGGMQQRVAIAQALITNPKILMMDEPFGALDPETREAMQVFLLELWEEQRMTIFFVTHDMDEAVYLGTRVLVLSQYYTDDRGESPSVKRGSRIVADYQLPSAVNSTKVKSSPEFLEITAEIRQVGFNPEHLRHVSQFNLKHPDSFQTLTSEEHKPSVPAVAAKR